MLSNHLVLGKAEGPHGMSQENAQKIKKWHGHVTAGKTKRLRTVKAESNLS